MTSIDFDDAYQRSRDRPAFSNGTEGEVWTANWCDRCIHDKPARETGGEDGCALLTIAIVGRTPAEWLEHRGEDGAYSLSDQYHCIMFRPEDDPGPGEPEPIPDPPGQEHLLPREPYEGTRMLSQPGAEQAVSR